MKKILTIVVSILIAIGIVSAVLYIQIFSKKAKNEIKSQEQALIQKKEKGENITEEVITNPYDQKMKEQKDKAKAGVETSEEITVESLQTAISFIEENTKLDLEQIDETTVLNIAYNASILEILREYSTEKENPIFDLGTKGNEYAREALERLDELQKREDLKIEQQEPTEELQEDNENQIEGVAISIGKETVSNEKIDDLRIEIKNIMNEINKDRAEKVQKFAETLKMNNKEPEENQTEEEQLENQEKQQDETAKQEEKKDDE